jgi:hypothetical protein
LPLDIGQQAVFKRITKAAAVEFRIVLLIYISLLTADHRFVTQIREAAWIGCFLLCSFLPNALFVKITDGLLSHLMGTKLMMCLP